MAVAATHYALMIARTQSFDPILFPMEQSYLEKRQLFLRSYQFSRKQSLSEKVKTSLVRAKRLMWRRLRKVRRVVLSRFKFGFCYRRRRFLRLLQNHNRDSSSYCVC